MIAALPMYDPPWLRSANDRFWSLLARRLRDRGIEDVPDRLSRDSDPDDGWTSPALLLGQSCGYPLVTRLRETVQIVATPHYDAPGCAGPRHRSAILVRRDDPALSLADLRGARAGINGHDSNTGMNLFRAAIADVANGADFFASLTVTGSHRRSFAGILAGRIDVAAIDAVTLALLRDRYPRHADRVRILAWTAASPALPLITSAHTPASVIAAIREELAAMTTDPDARTTLQSLRLAGFTATDFACYQDIIAIERQATAQGYPLLR